MNEVLLMMMTAFVAGIMVSVGAIVGQLPGIASSLREILSELRKLSREERDEGAASKALRELREKRRRD